MAPVSARSQRLQLIKQADSFTAPAGTGWLIPQLTTFTLQPVTEGRDEIYVEGGNWPTQTEVGTEHASLTLGGPPSFNELHYPFNMLFGSGTPTAGATTDAPAITRVWNAAQFSEHSRLYYAFEKGTSAYFRRFTAGHLMSFGLETDRKSQSMSGEGVAKRMAHALTSGYGTNGTIARRLVDMNRWAVHADTTWAGLTTNAATNQLGTTAAGVHGLNVYNVAFNLGDLSQVLWTVDDRHLSWTDVAGGDSPNMRLELTVDANAAGEAYIASARAGDTVYLRLRNNSEPTLISTSAIAYNLVIDMALNVLNVREYSTVSGVYAVGYTFSGVWDGTQMMRAALINAIAAD